MENQQATQPVMQQQTPHSVLSSVFGYKQFRAGQEQVIDAVLAGQDCLVLMPTGGGKSLCYQVPALLLPGITIVVSPLISLMQDQVAQLKAQGVAAAYINNSQSREEQQLIYQGLHQGQIKILYVAPERLLTDDFSTRLQHLNIGLFAIDEAHCVSHWGHDFRPHYYRLGQLKQRFSHIPIMALTATADIATRNDIVMQLGLTNAHIYTGSF